MNQAQNQWEDLVIKPAAANAPAPKVQAAYLTHELRAPITSIRLGLEILSEQISGRLESDEKHVLAMAIRNTSRLEGLVNDIMDYTKIAAGKMAITKEACDARALVDDAVDAMTAAATAKAVRISKDVSPLLPRAAAESRRVVQVLINLISNAVKYTPPRGAITISVSEGRYEHQGTLLFKVKDTGAGIASDQLDKIFGLFEQASLGAPKTAGGTGTGLGLTLARAMVELHGGKIWAESWKDCGATFCFTIPIAPIDLAHPVPVYVEPLKLHGLLAEFGRRFNAFLALVV